MHAATTTTTAVTTHNRHDHGHHQVMENPGMFVFSTSFAVIFVSTMDFVWAGGDNYEGCFAWLNNGECL